MLRGRLLLSAPVWGLLVAAVATAGAFTSPRAAPAATSRPLTMAIIGAPEIFGPDSKLAFKRIRAQGITAIDTLIDWREAVPADEPTGWDPTNPNDPHYNWASNDARIKAIVAAGFQPIGSLATAPVWGQLMPVTPFFTQSGPIPEKYAAFVRAAAQHYSGRTPGVPRIRFWQVWNEPNIGLFFWPQFDDQGRFTSPDVYRDIVNRAAAALHGVRSDNVVIAGETAPFRDTTPEVHAKDPDWGPLKFMRRMLCVDDAGRPTCNDSASFDVWSTHPYTSGGPRHQATLKYDVSLGDLPEMKATLSAAARAGHVRSAKPPRFWVTEFSWDSAPPDKCAVPMSLLQRWVPESFYRMWATGIDLVGWFQLVDDPLDKSYFQSGLYLRGSTFAAAKPKGFLPAFRFPFVALRRGNGVYVWAHTPFGRRGPVAVQQNTGRGWKRVKLLRADRNGIAQAVLKVRPAGQFRAVLGGGERSLPFSMRVPADKFFNPFGQASGLEPNGKSCSP